MRLRSSTPRIVIGEKSSVLNMRVPRSRRASFSRLGSGDVQFCNERYTCRQLRQGRIIAWRPRFSYIVPPMTASSLIPGSADVLLFDIGRVVLDIDFGKVMSIWAGHAGCAPSDVAGRFVVDDNFRHHETGKIDDAAFFESLRGSLGIAITDAQFLEGWNAIFAGEIAGIAPP